MATYLIGDIQGCFVTLKRLCERLAVDPGRDRLYLLGDLVNRGPHSLEVLRWAHEHRSSVSALLGNHELHLLARSMGMRVRKRSDTFERLMSAPDRDALLAWIRSWPPLVELGDVVLVHAGIHPSWSLDQVRRLAAKASKRLRGENWNQLVSALYDRSVDPQWSDEKRGLQRAQTVLRVLTRVRCLDASGRADYDFAGSPEEAPDGLVPWYRGLDSSFSEKTVVFGHWAALGHRRLPGAVALDSGCVYGGSLTALRLEDLEVFQEPLADATYWS